MHNTFGVSFTADHGFLLQDDIAVEGIAWGKAPKRRHVLLNPARKEPNIVSVSLGALGYDGQAGHLHFSTTTNPFARGKVIAIIELARRGWVEPVPVNTRAWPVMVHQLLALTLQFGAISLARCWQQLSVVLDFSGVTLAEFETLIAHMLRENFLFESGGLLSMGDCAEKVFGRKNFMELYAVFSSPVLYKVQTKAGYGVGSLEQAFVDKLVEEISSFLLGGRAWVVQQVNHSDRTIQVQSAPSGKKPSWGSFIPQLLGYEICQQVAEILVGFLSYTLDRDFLLIPVHGPPWGILRPAIVR